MVHPLQYVPAMRIVVCFAIVLAGCIGDLPQPGPVQNQPDAGVDAPKPIDAPPPKDAATLMKDFSGCLTRANFDTANMASAWGTLLTSTAKQCQNCHQDGAYSFIATSDGDKFFSAISMHSYYMAMYFTADVPNQKVIVNMSSFQAANSASGHPPFNYTTNQGIDALNAFYGSTIAVSPCAAPTLVD
jgi:hypothetical protein